MKKRIDRNQIAFAFAIVGVLLLLVAWCITWRSAYVLIPATQADVRALRAELQELREHVMAQPIVTTDGAKVEVLAR